MYFMNFESTEMVSYSNVISASLYEGNRINY